MQIVPKGCDRGIDVSPPDYQRGPGAPAATPRQKEVVVRPSCYSGHLTSSKFADQRPDCMYRATPCRRFFHSELRTTSGGDAGGSEQWQHTGLAG